MNNCPNCNQSCNNGDCGCIPQGMTTPNYCPADLPSCPDPSPCNETFDSNCVYYTGASLPCVGVSNGQTVQEVINAFATKLNPFFCLECVNFVTPATGSTGAPYTQALNWNMVTGAIAYDVYFGTDSANLPLVSLGQVVTTYTHPYPLLPNTTYYWQVIPRNASGTTTLSCPVYSFSTVAVSCVNPLKNFFDQLISINPSTETDPEVIISNISKVIQNLLISGELLTTCNYCCPDCTDTHRYVLASAPQYSTYYNAVYSSTCLPPCCIEVSASLTSMAEAPISGGPTLSEAFAAVPPNTNCCGTGFSNCVDSIKTTLPTAWYSIFVGAGLIEESTFNDTTNLCIIVDFINALPSVLTEQQKADIIVSILTAGFVVDCRPEGTIIAGINAYLDYLNMVSPSCLCYKPCTTA
jgi:hypothetical protein